MLSRPCVYTDVCDIYSDDLHLAAAPHAAGAHKHGTPPFPSCCVSLLYVLYLVLLRSLPAAGSLVCWGNPTRTVGACVCVCVCVCVFARALPKLTQALPIHVYLLYAASACG